MRMVKFASERFPNRLTMHVSINNSVNKSNGE